MIRERLEPRGRRGKLGRKVRLGNKASEVYKVPSGHRERAARKVTLESAVPLGSWDRWARKARKVRPACKACRACKALRVRSVPRALPAPSAEPALRQRSRAPVHGRLRPLAAVHPGLSGR